MKSCLMSVERQQKRLISEGGNGREKVGNVSENT